MQAGPKTPSTSASGPALADQERVLGPDHPNIDARNNLAVSYMGAGRSQDALSMLELVLSDSERLLGSDHPYRPPQPR
ncbi:MULTISPECIES: tetratricopeptide repeat protein [Streptomyces]|uniref:tetratricopeptide repeat protein n=1 Tax=Streptomyces TaxID=1883 RepID=UPI003318CFB2